MPGRIRTCLFDMGNVLLYFSHDRMCAQMGEVCGRTAEQIREAVMDSGLQARFECGLPPEAYHRLFEEAVGLRVDFDELMHAHTDIFWPNEEVVPVIDALKSRGIRLVLLSNTDPVHFAFCRRRFEVLSRFDDFVASYRVGAMKPSDEIYQTALNAARCDPGGCFYTDDITGYVERARTFGIDAETYTGVERLLRDFAERGLELDRSGH